MGLHQSEHKINEIIQFAASWSDLPEEYFKNFYEEVKERHRTSSSRQFSLFIDTSLNSSKGNAKGKVIYF